MRLKEDSSSYNAQGVRNKEYRHSPIGETVIKKPSKKDTKRWCKGIVGRGHDWEMVIPKNEEWYARPFRPICTCKKCGKQDYDNTEYWCEKHKHR